MKHLFILTILLSSLTAQALPARTFTCIGTDTYNGTSSGVTFDITYSLWDQETHQYADETLELNSELLAQSSFDMKALRNKAQNSCGASITEFEHQGNQVYLFEFDNGKCQPEKSYSIEGLCHITF